MYKHNHIHFFFLSLHLSPHSISCLVRFLGQDGDSAGRHQEGPGLEGAHHQASAVTRSPNRRDCGATGPSALWRTLTHVVWPDHLTPRFNIRYSSVLKAHQPSVTIPPSTMNPRVWMCVFAQASVNLQNAVTVLISDPHWILIVLGTASRQVKCVSENEGCRDVNFSSIRM